VRSGYMWRLVYAAGLGGAQPQRVSRFPSCCCEGRFVCECEPLVLYCYSPLGILILYNSPPLACIFGVSRLYSTCIPGYPTVSRLSHCIQLYPFVSSCIQLYPAVSHRIPPPRKRDMPTKHTSGSRLAPGEGSIQ